MVSRINNVNETVLTVIQGKIPKILTLKDRRQVGALTAAECGALITVVCCYNVNGDYIPSMLIFPRGKKCVVLEKHAR